MKNDSLKLVFSIHRDYSDYDTYWKKVQSEQEIWGFFNIINKKEIPETTLTEKLYKWRQNAILVRDVVYPWSITLLNPSYSISVSAVPEE